MKQKKTVGVIGLGYVGLPIAIASANAGYQVVGIDLNATIINDLNKGLSHVVDVQNFAIQSAINSGLFKVSITPDPLKECNIIIICVPTPLDSSKKPDLSYINSAISLIGKFLVKGQLIILESTVAPETTRKFFIPLIYENSNLQMGDLFFAFSPERIDPGNSDWNLKNTTKLLSAIDSESEKMAFEFYSDFVSDIYICSTIEIAETAKLLENSFRLLNISFINELSMFCDELGIDINQVVDAASSKPYGFMSFRPSLGAGGHCIPVDPIYLAQKAIEVGRPINMIDLAFQINNFMPQYFINKAFNFLGELKNKKVLVIGIAYKPNISDVRETPVKSLIDGLKEKGAIVSWHDDLVKNWRGESSAPLEAKYDLAILATYHDYLDLSKIKGVEILTIRNQIL